MKSLNHKNMKALKYENMKARNHKNIRTRSRDFMFSCSRDRGFVLPLAVLLAGILLSIGLAIFSITLKELTLSSSGRESQIAFFAADAGTECALYWDVRHPNFQTTIFDTYTASESALPKQTFSYTGGSQTFTVPAGVTSVTVKTWGAGGGGATNWGGTGGPGGAGGYVQATVTVSPGENLIVVAGKGGQKGDTPVDNGYMGGDGGGYSGVFRGSVIQSNALAIGGAGGGGSSNGGQGGPGGGTSGLAGTSASSGGGGTQSAGGSGGNQAGGALCGGTGGSNGSACGSAGYSGGGQRGVGSSNPAGGGGGAGYYGGGGGVYGGGDGGGGSSYATTTATSVTNTAGSGTTPPNTSDSDYASGIGVGGANSTNGGNGRVVISWSGSQEGEHKAVPQGSNAFCGGEDITLPASGWDANTGWDSVVSEANAVTTTFDMKFQNGTCASVTVKKDNGATQIDSRGYNSCDFSNQRRVERGLRVLY
ncbi:MAG: pilus assembly PilX N-terminal domain-containing protein [Patescibacteria group bacterium]